MAPSAPANTSGTCADQGNPGKILMFTRFTNPEGKGVWVRSSSVRAFAEQEDGAVRLFLGYGLQTDVVESAAAVLCALGASDDRD